ncbi:OmpA/MotB domain protein [Pseudofrankia inefficax]|uniref:OmpA/MotB domain protein n=1 Tax=Pseudofrankia inefficax (strain DSM 45817 / CECT 9037 / DDB 130130 / EuI1c) TaxID=298654 RepID=E3IZ37_PSEI1|nr:OmpA/MotB domain protein [Pseudofrankia inefficax]
MSEPRRRHSSSRAVATALVGRRFGGLVLVGVLGLTALSACGGAAGGGAAGAGAAGAGAADAAGGGTSVATACAGRNTATASGAVKGATVLLLDRTVSARGPGALDAAAAMVPEVRAAVDRGDVVSVAGFDGSSATLSWRTVATAFDGDATQASYDRARSRACLNAAVRSAWQGAPQAVGTDVLGAMYQAALLLHQAPAGRRHLVVATDGLVNVGCASVLDASFQGSPAPTVQACAQTRELPDLSGTTVILNGVGHPASSQPQPSSSGQLVWLTTLWQQLCAAARAAQCSVLSNVTASETAIPAENGAADEPVDFPAQPRPRPAGTGVFTVSLPDQVLFARDSNDLSPDADLTLTAVVSEVRGLRGSVVNVIGHTDTTGTDAYNRLLSKSRADAVADALVARGLPVASRTGAGSSIPGPGCGPEHRPDGTDDERAMRCDRRVELVIAVPPEGN